MHNYPIAHYNWCYKLDTTLYLLNVACCNVQIWLPGDGHLMWTKLHFMAPARPATNLWWSLNLTAMPNGFTTGRFDLKDTYQGNTTITIYSLQSATTANPYCTCMIPYCTLLTVAFPNTEPILATSKFHSVKISLVCCKPWDKNIYRMTECKYLCNLSLSSSLFGTGNKSKQNQVAICMRYIAVLLLSFFF